MGAKEMLRLIISYYHCNSIYRPEKNSGRTALKSLHTAFDQVHSRFLTKGNSSQNRIVPEGEMKDNMAKTQMCGSTGLTFQENVKQ